MTIENLEKKIADLQQQIKQLEANAFAVNGALQFAKIMLDEEKAALAAPVAAVVPPLPIVQ